MENISKCSKCGSTTEVIDIDPFERTFIYCKNCKALKSKIGF